MKSERHEMSNLSPEASAVWDALDKEHKKVLQKDYPFPSDRNKLIRDLRSKLVKLSIISEISGIPRSTVHRIGKGKNTSISGESPSDNKIIKMLANIQNGVEKLLAFSTRKK